MRATDTERVNLIREVLKALQNGEFTELAALIAIGTIVQESRPLTEEEMEWVATVTDRLEAERDE